MFDDYKVEFVNDEGIAGAGILAELSNGERTEDYEVRGIFYRDPVSNQEKRIDVESGITTTDLYLLGASIDEEDIIDYLDLTGESFTEDTPDEAEERLAGDEETVLEDFYEVAKESGVPEVYLYYIDYDKMLNDERLSGYMAKGDHTEKWWRMY